VQVGSQVAQPGEGLWRFVEGVGGEAQQLREEAEEVQVRYATPGAQGDPGMVFQPPGQPAVVTIGQRLAELNHAYSGIRSPEQQSPGHRRGHFEDPTAQQVLTSRLSGVHHPPRVSGVVPQLGHLRDRTEGGVHGHRTGPPRAEVAATDEVQGRLRL